VNLTYDNLSVAGAGDFMREGWSRTSVWLPACLPLLFAALSVPFAAQSAPPAPPMAESDEIKPDGEPWDPAIDTFSRSVFDSFDHAAVPPHIKLLIENLKPGDRPPHFRLFLLSGAALTVLFAAIAAVARRRRLREYLHAPRRGPPDDILWMALIMGVALVLRVVAVFLLPLHGSEWGSVEHKSFAQIPDILFNGFEVLTNPPLLNLLEHFVFPLSGSPVAFRIPIVLFGLGLVWAARNAGRELFSRRAGIIAAAFVAVNCGLVVWSATMRAYLPMMTFILAAVPAAYRMASGRGRDRDAVMLAVFGALAAWTHYVALIWLVCMYLLVVIGRRRDIRALLATGAAALWSLFLFFPLLPFFFFDMGTKQASSLPPGFAMDMLAITTGLAGGLGFLVPAAIAAARFYRLPGALWLAGLAGGYLAAVAATTGIIHWEVSYSVGFSAVVMILLAGVVDRLRHHVAASVVMIVLLLSTCGLMFAEPSSVAAVADATRPFLWRSVSNRMFADEIMKEPARGLGPDGRIVVLVTPAYESEPYLYHLGPVTPAQAGVEPVVVRNFDEMMFEAPSASGRIRAYTLIGFERYWGWHLGQWPELERFRERFGAFWYARLQQNCSNGSGFTWSPRDCAWLERHCRLVESMASDELYLCGAGAR